MTHDEKIDRGTDERIRVELDGEPDSEWDGLSTADFWWVLVDEPDGGNVILQHSHTESNIDLVDAGGGTDSAVFTVDIDRSDTRQLDQGQYYQEALIRDDAGRVAGAKLEPYRLRVRDSPADEVLGE